MSIHELIYELCQGFRLPTPPDCPRHISKLLSQCFHEEPNTRPNFTEIKEDLQSAYDVLMEHELPNLNLSGNQDHPGYATVHGYASVSPSNKMNDGLMNTAVHGYASMSPINKLNDGSMKRKYMSMKRGNNKRQLERSITQYDEKIGEVEKRKSIVKYASPKKADKSKITPELSHDYRRRSGTSLVMDDSDDRGLLPESNKGKQYSSEGDILTQICSYPGEGEDLIKDQNNQN